MCKTSPKVPGIRKIMSEGRAISKARVLRMMGRIMELRPVKGIKLALIKVIPTPISKEDRVVKMGRMDRMVKTFKVSKVVRDPEALEGKEIRPIRL